MVTMEKYRMEMNRFNRYLHKSPYFIQLSHLDNILEHKKYWAYLSIEEIEVLKSYLNMYIVNSPKIDYYRGDNKVEPLVKLLKQYIWHDINNDYYEMYTNLLKGYEVIGDLKEVDKKIIGDILEIIKSDNTNEYFKTKYIELIQSTFQLY